MGGLVPDAALTHSAVDEVLQLLASASAPSLRGGAGGPGGRGRGSGLTPTGSLPSGMRAWVEKGLLLVEAV
jgi:hypothetical protein